MSDTPRQLTGYLSYVLAAAHREVRTSLSQRLKAFGIQIEAWRIMATLASHPAVTMSELADLVLMNPPALTKLVDRMVSSGLVHRQISRQDQRQVNLILTDLGKKRMSQIRAEVQSEDDEILAAIGSENVELFVDMLQKISPRSARLSQRPLPRRTPKAGRTDF